MEWQARARRGLFAGGRTADALNSAFARLLDFIYPRLCVACEGAVGSEGTSLCWDCRSTVHLIQPPFCAVCGDPAEGRIEHEYTCPWCEEGDVFFEKARSAARYRAVLRTALQAFKYRKVTSLSNDFGPLMTACLQVHYSKVPFDAVTFVPLHATRERSRTYNQARILAQGLAAQLGLSPVVRSLKRVRATTTQTDLTAAERRANVKGAFEAVDGAWLAGRSLLLVDDVMTTGATVNECARVLKDVGVARVHVMTLARG